jgi:hypothetical protein
LAYPSSIKKLDTGLLGVHGWMAVYTAGDAHPIKSAEPARGECTCYALLASDEL